MAGIAKTVFDRFRFLVEIDGMKNTGFQKAKLPEIECDTIEYREGGANRPLKEPGQWKVGDIELSLGVTTSDEFIAWLDKVKNKGQSDKRNLSIIALDASGKEIGRWNVYGAFIKAVKYEDLDATSNEKWIETITLACDDIYRVK